MTVPISNMTATFNNAANTYNAISMNVVTGGQSSNSKLLNLKANGVSKFSVDLDGDVSANGDITVNKNTFIKLNTSTNFLQSNNINVTMNVRTSNVFANTINVAGPVSIIRTNDTSWYTVFRFLRGTGQAGIQMDVLGDGANGVDGIRFYDRQNNVTLGEMDLDGNFFLAGKIGYETTLLQKVVKVHWVENTTQYTRTSETEGTLSDGAGVYPLLPGVTSLTGFYQADGYAQNTGNVRDDRRADIRLKWYNNSAYVQVGSTQYVGGTNYGTTAEGTTYGIFCWPFYLDETERYTNLGGEPWWFRLYGEVGYADTTISVRNGRIIAIEWF